MYLDQLIKHIESDLAHHNMIRVRNLNAINDLTSEIAILDKDIKEIETALAQVTHMKDING